MSTDPDQLRRDIERTRHGLSTDVDALAEKVAPRQIVRRRMDRAREAMTNVKDTVMGTADDVTSGVGDQVSSTASTVGDSVSSAASSAAQAVGEAPAAIRRTTVGNPLAAGLVAFGLGWLVASLIPPTRKEQEVARQAKQVAEEQVMPAVSEAADEVQSRLRERAEGAVHAVADTARDAGGAVADHARSAAGNVKDETTNAMSGSGGQQHRPI